jgi:hypothetical protein
VADVAVVVGRDAADVHADLAGRPRPERLPLPRLRVVQVQVRGTIRGRAVRGGAGGGGEGRGAKEGPGGVGREAAGAQESGQG